MIRNNQRRRRGGGNNNNGPRPQQMNGGGNYGNRLDNRQRGNATQLLEKYRALARDAQQAGDRVTAEYYLQYAEHYYRVLGDYRDRQPEGRRGQYDDDGMDGDDAENDGMDNGDNDDRDDRSRDVQARDDRSRDDRPRERTRDDRPRDDRPREDRQREHRPRDDRPRDDRPREDRPREERPRDDRPRDDNNRRDWQRDRRPQAPRSAPVNDDGGDDRESLLQALPPAVSREPATADTRRLGLKRSPAADVPPPVEVTAPAAEADAAPRRRGRPRKVAEPAAE